MKLELQAGRRRRRRGRGTARGSLFLLCVPSDGVVVVAVLEPAFLLVVIGLLVRRLLANIDRKHEGDLRISLLDAIHFIAMAWDRVTPTTIANCFAKCGFFRSSEEVPSEQEEPIEGWELLDAGCTAEDFCTADDNLATCGARTVEDIVEEATCEVADSSDDGDNIDEGDGEGPPPAAETLHALDVLRRAMAADEISDDTSASSGGRRGGGTRFIGRNADFTCVGGRLDDVSDSKRGRRIDTTFLTSTDRAQQQKKTEDKISGLSATSASERKLRTLATACEGSDPSAANYGIVDFSAINKLLEMTCTGAVSIGKCDRLLSWCLLRHLFAK
ncbi:hypothetical protein HPB52_012442 [Rhipicephalus sanguineus]|uniref:Uncharacterized protein n=1 Tax=Rhipicephalus sanguineus TaxID=34632 RepID=A0A9D4QAU2_RHISA|nr:hypothetical protein HPB52_012442 [Rhipicephalus sanguineus]